MDVLYLFLFIAFFAFDLDEFVIIVLIVFLLGGFDSDEDPQEVVEPVVPSMTAEEKWIQEYGIYQSSSMVSDIYGVGEVGKSNNGSVVQGGDTTTVDLDALLGVGVEISTDTRVGDL